MPTDTTITRYGSTGANQGFAIVVRPDGPWVRYEDHERALTAAHAALANLPGHTCHVSGDTCGGCEYARERDKRIAAAHAARDAWRSAALRVGEDMATIGPVGYYEFTPAEWRAWALITLATALRERDEARSALARYEADDRRIRRVPSGSGPW